MRSLWRFLASVEGLITFLGALIIIFGIVAEVFQYFPVKEQKVKIIDVQRYCSNESCHWIVYTDGSTPLKITDLPFIFYFNSGDVANQLVKEKGKECVVETRGIRWYFPTIYPVVVKVKECF